MDVTTSGYTFVGSFSDISKSHTTNSQTQGNTCSLEAFSLWTHQRGLAHASCLSSTPCPFPVSAQLASPSSLSQRGSELKRCFPNPNLTIQLNQPSIQARCFLRRPLTLLPTLTQVLTPMRTASLLKHTSFFSNSDVRALFLRHPHPLDSLFFTKTPPTHHSLPPATTTCSQEVPEILPPAPPPRRWLNVWQSPGWSCLFHGCDAECCVGDMLRQRRGSITSGTSVG